MVLVPLPSPTPHTASIKISELKQTSCSSKLSQIDENNLQSLHLGADRSPHWHTYQM